MYTRPEKPAGTGVPEKGIVPYRGYTPESLFLRITDENAIVAVFKAIDRTSIKPELFSSQCQLSILI